MTTSNEVGIYYIEIIVQDEDNTQINETFTIELVIAESDCRLQEELVCNIQNDNNGEGQSC